MKKITLVLCAAAIACTAFFTSCDNGAKTYTDVTYEEYENTYDLVSFTEVTKITEDKTDAAGNAVTVDPSTTTNVFTADAKSGKNKVKILWTDSEVVDGFVNYKLIITDNVTGKGKSKTNDGEFTAEIDISTGSTSSNPYNLGLTTETYNSDDWSVYYYPCKVWNFYKQDGKYYIATADGYTLVTGDPEKDTTISFTDVSVTDNVGWKANDAKNKDIVTTTTTYTIVLKASESL